MINDFTAVAIATSRLSLEDLTTIKAGHSEAVANRAILGPGTGLGVAGLVYHNGAWVPIASEGGHVNMAPATIYEAEIIKAGIKRFGHVSAEVFVSGPGLVNLYSSVCDIEGEPAEVLLPEDVTARALSGEDPICRKTLEVFCCFLGTVSGNLVLTYGAKGGVYIAGGIVPQIENFLKSSKFIERFSNKGIMSHYVKNVPVSLISYEQTAFLGAATWLNQFI